MYKDRSNEEANLDSSTQEEDDKDLDDWNGKYSITIDLLCEEYYNLLDCIHVTDEKAGKYVIVFSIFITGAFTLLFGSLIDKLTFKDLAKTVDFLSWVFICVTVIYLVYGVKIIFKVIDSIRFVETRRPTDLNVQLDETGSTNETEYKGYLIEHYQEAINFTRQALIHKQEKVEGLEKDIKIFIILIIISVFILLLLKLI